MRGNDFFAFYFVHVWYILFITEKPLHLGIGSIVLITLLTLCEGQNLLTGVYASALVYELLEFPFLYVGKQQAKEYF